MGEQQKLNVGQASRLPCPVGEDADPTKKINGLFVGLIALYPIFQYSNIPGAL